MTTTKQLKKILRGLITIFLEEFPLVEREKITISLHVWIVHSLQKDGRLLNKMEKTMKLLKELKIIFQDVVFIILTNTLKF